MNGADAEVVKATEFLREHDRAVLITRRMGGGIQASPVTAGIDAEGRAIISTSEGTAKARNLRRDSRAALCVLTERFFGSWVQVDGEAEIVSLPEAMDPLVDYYRRLAGEHPDWEDYRAAMVRDRRCLIRIRIEHAVIGG